MNVNATQRITIAMYIRIVCYGLMLAVFCSGCTSKVTLTTCVIPEKGGAITYDPVRPAYSKDETVTLTATPNPGYTFEKWDGGYKGTENPAKITLAESLEVNACFVVVPVEPPKANVPPADPAPAPSPELQNQQSEEKGTENDVSGTIKHPEMLPVAAGTFMMGRSYPWDPVWGQERTNEVPVHEVYLNAYEMGKYPVTNQEYADVLNWAYGKGLLQNEDGSPYTNGLVFAFGMPLADTEQSTSWSHITFKDGKFTVRTNPGYQGKEFSMADHPVVVVDWYGVLCYCNWLSEIEGLEPCYSTDDWTRYEPVRNGYRPPTEAEWERAAAWDGSRHWTYGFMSDTLDVSRANYGYAEGKWANPQDLMNVPRTSPVGWYNGKNPVHLSTPDKLTVDSPSPVGAYDMTGNVWEWCHDWWCRTYTEEPIKNPTGLESGTYKCLRGCAWFYPGPLCRTAYRSTLKPLDRRSYNYGFRLARTP
jgi:formylglycine-generating enzyme required for sulfatase activity